METYEMLGVFSDAVKIYHYPSVKPSQKVILVLKGIYGEHIPGGSSWDNELINLLQSDYHLVFVRTSRLDGKNDRDAFVGKTFEQECTEVEHAFEYCTENIFPKNFVWGCIGVSFGGTILLGTPMVLAHLKTVIMVGSGCGRNPETTKPLLSTLPETEQLLHSLDKYHSIFVFLHGEDDAIVPEGSQRLIYGRAGKHTAKHEWIDLPNLDHSLRDVNTKESHMAEMTSRCIRKNLV